MRQAPLILALVSFALVLSACTRPDERMYPIGPDVRADLFIIFKTTASPEEVYKFSNETISDPKDGGSWPLPGIHEILHVYVDGREAYAVRFFPGASEDQRKYVRSRIDSSPLVFKVMENVVPSDIKKVQ
jgi:hypothetical protein